MAPPFAQDVLIPIRCTTKVAQGDVAGLVSCELLAANAAMHASPTTIRENVAQFSRFPATAAVVIAGKSPPASCPI